MSDDKWGEFKSFAKKNKLVDWAGAAAGVYFFFEALGGGLLGFIGSLLGGAAIAHFIGNATGFLHDNGSDRSHNLGAGKPHQRSAVNEKNQSTDEVGTQPAVEIPSTPVIIPNPQKSHGIGD